MINNFLQTNNKSFTLIELLVVLALVAILSVVVVLTLNPAELLKQARDSNRLSDLATINTALNLFSTDVIGGFMGTSTVVYVSLPDNSSSTCGSWGLPALPAGYIYNCVTSQNLRNTNGTGWIPVNFQRISSNSPISQLPIDPINTTSTGNYYTYVSGGSWILTAIPESVKQKADLSIHPQITNYPGVIGMGNNLNLSPLFNSTGLAGYWKFDEGTGTITKDSSGNGNDGTIIGAAPAWTAGKVGSGLDFNGADNYVDIPDNNSLDITTTLTVSAWVNFISSPSEAVQTYLIQKWSGTADANYVWYWYSGGAYTPNGNAILAMMGTTWGGMSSYYNFSTDSTWRHFVQTYNSAGYSTTYVDGTMIQQWTPSYGNLATNNRSVYIGQFSAGYRAKMDDIRIYNRELSAAEVLALYNATK